LSIGLILHYFRVDGRRGRATGLRAPPDPLDQPASFFSESRMAVTSPSDVSSMVKEGLFRPAKAKSIDKGF
jgi:hypothetical protein